MRQAPPVIRVHDLPPLPQERRATPLNALAHDYLLTAAKKLRKLNAMIEFCSSDQDVRDAIGALYSYTREARDAAILATHELDGTKPKAKPRRKEI